MKNSGKGWLSDPSIWKGTWRDDWRIMGQEGYLMERKLQHRRFNRTLCVEDYDQCEFCYECFDTDPKYISKAFFDPITKCWICEDCYFAFKEHFGWTVEEIDD